MIDNINRQMCRIYKDFKIYIISELRILGYGQRKNVQDFVMNNRSRAFTDERCLRNKR